jgi:nitrate reductase gamma subunit
MAIILITFAYLAYAAFWVRLSLHAAVWYRAVRKEAAGPPGDREGRARSCTAAVLDIVFFRRLFESNKRLWTGSWAFHAAFLFVMLRHLSYFLEPVPDFIIRVQTCGIVAGYVLAFSLGYVILFRTFTKKKYQSYQNLLVLGLVFLISVTGLLMRNYFRPDLVDVKSFTMGLLALRPAPLPGGFFFTIHFSLFLLLIPYLPFHLFTAPFITFEARRREDLLDRVLHDR